MSGAPLICTLTRGDTHGGIARVSELLWRAAQAITLEGCRRLSLFPGEAGQATIVLRGRYAGSVLVAQIVHRPAWILFDHLGMARPQALLPPRWRAPYGIFLHSVEAWHPLAAHRKRVLRNADVLIANSQYTSRRVAASHPDLPPIQVCHLALDERGHASQDRLDHAVVQAISHRSVLIVGRMLSAERHKGHDNLLDIWRDLLNRIDDAQLVVVGQGDDVPRYRAKAESLGLSGRVLFTGRVSEATLHAIYDRVRVYAMPAKGEGFGLVYLEAMSHGLPCVASRYDAAAEIVVDGETGFLVDPDDRGALVDRLTRLLEDQTLASRLGAAGRERWQSHFSFARFQSRVGSILAPLRAHEDQRL